MRNHCAAGDTGWVRPMECITPVSRVCCGVGGVAGVVGGLCWDARTAALGCQDMPNAVARGGSWSASRLEYCKGRRHKHITRWRVGLGVAAAPSSRGFRSLNSHPSLRHHLHLPPPPTPLPQWRPCTSPLPPTRRQHVPAVTTARKPPQTDPLMREDMRQVREHPLQQTPIATSIREWIRTRGGGSLCLSSRQPSPGARRAMRPGGWLSPQTRLPPCNGRWSCFQILILHRPSVTPWPQFKVPHPVLNYHYGGHSRRGLLVGGVGFASL